MNLDKEQKADMISLIGRLKVVDDCGNLIPELQAKLGKR